MPEHIEDELLVLGCQSGDPEALAALVCRWQPRLRRLAARLTGDGEAAGDIVQDAWLAVLRGLRRLEDPARFRSWAYRIVANRSADWVRRRAVRRGATAELGALAAARVAESQRPAPGDGDEAARLPAALRALPAAERSILSLHYLEGLSLLEIAAVFDLPVGTVKSRLHHARGQLRALFEEHENGRVGQENRGGDPPG